MSTGKEAADSPVTGEVDLGRRQSLADDRDRMADDRERLADDREDEADSRQALADEREREADEREREADERELEANERQALADRREAEIDHHARKLHAPAVAPMERTAEAIGRGRDAVAASGQRLDRSEAALRRTAKQVRREQADIDRAAAQGERDLQRQLPDPAEARERAGILRRRMAETAAALAKEQEEIARIHDALAARRPEDAPGYLRIADQARREADRARQAEQEYGD